ncbi:MAG TPA: type II toxin-antitoxin system VapB family antitoxin [Acidimicrobiia bacterium]|jgi:Arc/MetJ family transcription regulator|nr:type II toxin-antitoxin system VapB family antitoxin [Acidimicrobiia bacterium]
MTRRTSIIVDDALLEAAQRALGTRGLKETIDTALQEAIRNRRRQRLLARLRDPDGFDDDALRKARDSWRI